MKLSLSSVNSEDSTADGGEFILNLFRETIDYLWEDAENIRVVLDGELDIGKDSKLKAISEIAANQDQLGVCLLYTSPSPRDQRGSRMPSSA